VRVNEVGNLFDHFGSILSLPRINGEDNLSYSARIKSVPNRRRGSDYQGLVNGITMELALSQKDVIDVTIKSEDVQGKRLLVEEGYIKLYSEWISEEDQEMGLRPTLEKEARLGTEPIKTIGKLVDWINESEYFTATLIEDTNQTTDFLVQFDSRIVVREELPAQEIIHLTYPNIIQGSFALQQNTNLKKEISYNESLESAGEYHIDYQKGVLKCFSAPLNSVKSVYMANRSNFKLTISDIKLVDLATKGAQRLYFNQIDKRLYTNMSESTANGLPTEEMFGIIRELLTAGDFDQYWGE
jgi:hypothetical protein